MTDRLQDNGRMTRVAKTARQGDPESRATLLRELQDIIFRFCLVQLGDRELSRDATQETGLRILQSLSGFRGASRVKTWALGIALNVCREFRRERVRQTAEEFDDDWGALQATAEETVSRNEDLKRLAASMKRLTDRQREAVTLRFFEDLSVAETAEAMQVAPGTVKATVAQAIEKMKGHWSRSHERLETRVGRTEGSLSVPPFRR